MGRANYKSDKRRKELARQKKQEEKRLKRFSKRYDQEKPQPGDSPQENAPMESLPPHEDEGKPAGG